MAAPLRPPRQLRRRSIESGNDSPRAKDAPLADLGLHREDSPRIPEEEPRETDELLDGFDTLPHHLAVAPGKKTDDIEAPRYADDSPASVGGSSHSGRLAAGGFNRKAFSQSKAGSGTGGGPQEAAGPLQGGQAAPGKRLPLRAGGVSERSGSGWSLFRGAGLCTGFGLPFVVLAVLWLLLVLAQRPASWRDLETGTTSLFGYRFAARVPASCERFVPTSCYFLAGKQEPRQVPAPTAKVSFDVDEELRQCPMATAGRYLSVPGPWCVEAPPRFWQPAAAPGPSCTQGACCNATGMTAGKFYSSENTGRTEFRPDGCELREFRRGETMQCLARPNGQAAILFIGDSMTRQIFTRLISLFRGEERSFDYGPHNTARYDVCGGRSPADRFTPSKQGVGQWVFEQAQDMDVHDVFNGRQYKGPSALDRCREPPVALEFAWGGHFEWHQLHLQRYIAEHDVSDTVITLLLTYHEQRGELPEFWTDAVKAAAAACKRLVIMTVPTALVKPAYAGYLPIWQGRNEAIRAWVPSQNATNIVLLDYDRLSRAAEAPRGLTGDDWHYQCLFNYREEADAAVAVPQRRFDTHQFVTPTGYLLNELWADERRDCIDDMNRILAQMILGLTCDT